MSGRFNRTPYFIVLLVALRPKREENFITCTALLYLQRCTQFSTFISHSFCSLGLAFNVVRIFWKLLFSVEINFLLSYRVLAFLRFAMCKVAYIKLLIYNHSIIATYCLPFFYLWKRLIVLLCTVFYRAKYIIHHWSR